MNLRQRGKHWFRKEDAIALRIGDGGDRKLNDRLNSDLFLSRFLFAFQLVETLNDEGPNFGGEAHLSPPDMLCSHIFNALTNIVDI